jgi:hypothetical protein
MKDRKKTKQMPRMPSLIAFVAAAVNKGRLDYWPNEVLMRPRFGGAKIRRGEDLGSLSMALASWCERAGFEPCVRVDAHRTCRIFEHWVAKGLWWMPPARSGSNPARQRQGEKIIQGAPRSSPHRILSPNRVLSRTEILGTTES